MTALSSFSAELSELRRQSLLREIRDRAPAAAGVAARITLGGVEYLNFSSNDYLGLAGSPQLCEAAQHAMAVCGFGSGASRLLSGGTELHRDLERLVTVFKETETAVLMNSGYTANISALPALAREPDLILTDELNHASLVDGCRLSRARRFIYRHGDVAHLREIVQREQSRTTVVITDTVFSMDGDIAPIRDIAAQCAASGALLYLDDAHGTGVLGRGRGALHHVGLRPEPWMVQMGTFSKALGSFGAFVAGSEEVIRWLTNAGRGLICSTALPPAVVAASTRAMELVQERQDLVDRLWSNRERLHRGLRRLGFDTMRSETPIIPIVVGDVRTTCALADRLLEHRIYAPAIRPPTVRIPRIRFTVTANHTEADLEELLQILSAA